MDTSALALLVLLTALALGAGVALGLLAAGRRGASTALPDLAPVESTLAALGRRLDEAETVRRSDQAGLRAEIGEHLRHVEATTEIIRRETGSLAAALGRVDVRGRWGEAHLRRLVESAGMLDHVDFVEQDTRSRDDGSSRPDLIVHLGSGRSLVVDAKVPLTALLEAEATDDPAARAELFERHARDVAAHADRLSAKDYWRRYDDSVELVVMFLPAESILGIALREDPTLLDRAFSRHVVIATPTTLLALLRTVAHVWRREAIADNAREIHAIGRELHERLGTFVEHVRRMGSSLDAAVTHYNKAVGSLEGRVLVSSRRLAGLGVGDSSVEAPSPLTQRTREPVVDGPGGAAA